MVTLFGGGLYCNIIFTGQDESIYTTLIQQVETDNSNGNISFVNALEQHIPGNFLTVRNLSTNGYVPPSRYIFLDDNNINERFDIAVIVHEYYHVLYHANMLDKSYGSDELPVWLGEGTAEALKHLYMLDYPAPTNYNNSLQTISEVLEYGKNYWNDDPAFNYRVYQENYGYPYQLYEVSVLYLSHLTTYYKVFSFIFPNEAYSKGWETAFNDIYGKTITSFYTELNNFIRNNTLQQIQDTILNDITGRTLTQLLINPDNV